MQHLSILSSKQTVSGLEREGEKRGEESKKIGKEREKEGER